MSKLLSEFKGEEDYMVALFLQGGPEALREHYQFSEVDLVAVFDYLVFEYDLLLRCVEANEDFFLNLYIEQGLTRVRDVLGVLDDKYNDFFEEVFDYLAIEKKGIYQHVLNFQGRYAEAVKKHGSDFVKKILRIDSEKYHDQWAEVLELLLSIVCKNMIEESQLDRGLEKFTEMFNRQRLHRKPFGSGFFLS